MNEEKNKFLAELVGWKITKFKYAPRWVRFGVLWEWATKQEWWIEDFLNACWGSRIHAREDLLDLINPDRFADALFDFLKRRKSE